MTRQLHAVAITLISAIGCTDPDVAPSSKYAEAVYGNYEQASDGRIAFELSVIDHGKLETIVERPLVDVLDGVPQDWIVFQARGNKLLDLGRGPRNAAIDEWTQPPELASFDAMGYPIADGTYRLLQVTATLDGVPSEHRALELCWQKQDHCIVIDPVVMQLDAYYQNCQRLQHDDWHAIETTETVDDATPPGTTAYTYTCKLLRTGARSQTYYWPGYTVTGQNILGWTLFQDFLGAQEDYIGCYASSGSCRAAASTFSNTSSCAGYWFWNCACDNIDHFGYTGSTAKTSAQTKCVDSLSGVSISAGLSGAGASFSITWNISSGSVYTNGGTYTDTCAWQ